MASPALFSNFVLASRRKRRIAPLPVSSKRSFSPSRRSAPSTEATVVRTSSPLSALDFLGGRWIWGTGIPPGRRLSGYVLGYWFGYWFGGYCPGGYCPGGYWLGGYCPVGYWPPVGYCAEAKAPHTNIAHTATTTGRKGRRILNVPPGSILYAFGPGGTPSLRPRAPWRGTSRSCLWFRRQFRRGDGRRRKRSWRSRRSCAWPPSSSTAPWHPAANSPDGRSCIRSWRAWRAPCDRT